jgi:hypothetical protein
VREASEDLVGRNALERTLSGLVGDDREGLRESSKVTLELVELDDASSSMEDDGLRGGVESDSSSMDDVVCFLP